MPKIILNYNTGKAYMANNSVLVSMTNIVPVTITPSTTEQVINISDEITGYGPITVSPVNSSIDPNISATNIVNGCEILGVVGMASDGGMYNTSVPQLLGSVDENGILTPYTQKSDLVFNGVKGFTNDALVNMWQNRPVVNSVSCPDAEYLDGFANAFAGDYYGIRGSVTLFSAPNATTAKPSSFRSAFNNVRNFENFYTPNLITAEQSSFSYAFNNCDSTNPNLVVNFSSLLEAQEYAFQGAFSGSSVKNNPNNLIMPNLRRVFNYAFQNAFNGYRLSYTNWTFPNIYAIGDYGFSNAFGNYQASGNNTNVYFPSLIPEFHTMYSATRSNRQFYNMLMNTYNSTVHFPENLEPIMNNWTDVANGFGGYNTTVLFDLPNAPTPPNEYIIDNGVLVNYAFSQKPLDFTGVQTIPNNVLTNCKGYLGSVDTVSFPDLVTVEDGGMYQAFCNNRELTTFSAPDLVVANLEGTFRYCTNLTNFYAPDLSLITGTYGLRNTFAYSGLTEFNVPYLITQSSSALNATFASCPNLTEVNLCGITGNAYLYGTFQNCPNLVRIDLSNITLTGYGTSYSSGSFFANCNNLSDVDLGKISCGTSSLFRNMSNLSRVNLSGIDSLFAYVNGSNINTRSRAYMFENSGITEVNFSGLSSTANINGGVSSYNLCMNMCYNCQNLEKVDLSLLKESIYYTYSSYLQNTFMSAFAECPNLTDVDMSNVTNFSSSNNFRDAFTNDISLTNVYFNSLINCGQYGFVNAFRNCSNLTEISFPNLTYGPYGLQYAFVDSGIKDIYLGGLTNSSTTSILSQMLTGCSDVNVHFKSNVNVERFTGYPTFGGTNINIYNDL